MIPGDAPFVPATEVERDTTGITDRDVTRKTVLGAAETFLNAVLYTPATAQLDIGRLWVEAQTVVIPAVRDYRHREAARAQSRADPSDEDPTDLTCEMP